MLLTNDAIDFLIKYRDEIKIDSDDPVKWYKERYHTYKKTWKQHGYSFRFSQKALISILIDDINISMFILASNE